MATCLQIAPRDIENSITPICICLYRSCRAWQITSMRNYSYLVILIKQLMNVVFDNYKRKKDRDIYFYIYFSKHIQIKMKER